MQTVHSKVQNAVQFYGAVTASYSRNSAQLVSDPLNEKLDGVNADFSTKVKALEADLPEQSVLMTR